ncbi:hypothetical protein HBI81_250950 [Parastagonospora nodorum]|nr:hypothetical protein HBI06_253350 [Parastagonospora nodorum]KAH4223084.1 hypothetical protein HBI05_249090 [Parastagonospora nodorum]KAH4893336.1 hypothetical protein HBI80_249440 [Parastagonospora nodorum]KAH5088443.1 hypothetical protein HBH72_244700 [Parastagonospora nodorum]KAH5389690.1 hypothetical protein HBI32_251390 [Parastagonospora nodorum]
MEKPLRHDTRQTPGALGLGQAMATRIYCAFHLFYYVTPIVVAIVADSYLGRYATLVVSTMLYCLGCLVLTASSVPRNLERRWGIPGMAIAMVLVGLGGGGFRATMVPSIVDQQAWTGSRLVTLETGEVVATDYQLTLQYICNLYYWVGNIGSLSWFATVYIESRVGFSAAYGLTLGFMVIASTMIVVGK